MQRLLSRVCSSIKNKEANCFQATQNNLTRTRRKVQGFIQGLGNIVVDSIDKPVKSHGEVNLICPHTEKADNVDSDAKGEIEVLE